MTKKFYQNPPKSRTRIKRANWQFINTLEVKDSFEIRMKRKAVNNKKKQKAKQYKKTERRSDLWSAIHSIPSPSLSLSCINSKAQHYHQKQPHLEFVWFRKKKSNGHVLHIAWIADAVVWRFDSGKAFLESMAGERALPEAQSHSRRFRTLGHARARRQRHWRPQRHHPWFLWLPQTHVQGTTNIYSMLYMPINFILIIPRLSC